MRLVPHDLFVFFSALSAGFQAVMHGARRSSTAESFAGSFATHNGATMYIIHSIGEQA